MEYAKACDRGQNDSRDLALQVADLGLFLGTLYSSVNPPGVIRE